MSLAGGAGHPRLRCAYAPAPLSPQGPAAKYISFKSAACRCFGFLVSKKKYVYTIDDDCFVATHPVSGEQVNVMAGHLRNLLTPATPYFFNTMCALFLSNNEGYSQILFNFDEYCET